MDALDTVLEASLLASLAQISGAALPVHVASERSAGERAALAAVRAVHPRLAGRFETRAGGLALSPRGARVRVTAAKRSILVRYWRPGSMSDAPPAREWLFTSDATPALVELV